MEKTHELEQFSFGLNYRPIEDATVFKGQLPVHAEIV